VSSASIRSDNESMAAESVKNEHDNLSDELNNHENAEEIFNEELNKDEVAFEQEVGITSIEFNVPSSGGLTISGKSENHVKYPDGTSLGIDVSHWLFCYQVHILSPKCE